MAAPVPGRLPALLNLKLNPTGYMASRPGERVVRWPIARGNRLATGGARGQPSNNNGTSFEGFS